MEKESPEKENVQLQELDQAGRPSLNVWQRLAGVLNNPRQTFADITARPRFAAGLVILCAVNLLIGLSILPKVRAFTIWTMEQQAGQMTPDAAMVKEMAATGAAFGVVITSVAGPLFFALLMAVLLFFFGYLVRSRAPFRALFAVGVFAYVPATIAGVIAGALIASRPAEQFDQVTTSLTMFLPAGAEGLPHRILSLVDPLGLGRWPWSPWEERSPTRRGSAKRRLTFLSFGRFTWRRPRRSPPFSQKEPVFKQPTGRFRRTKCD